MPHIFFFVDFKFGPRFTLDLNWPLLNVNRKVKSSRASLNRIFVSVQGSEMSGMNRRDRGNTISDYWHVKLHVQQLHVHHFHSTGHAPDRCQLPALWLQRLQQKSLTVGRLREY